MVHPDWELRFEYAGIILPYFRRKHFHNIDAEPTEMGARLHISGDILMNRPGWYTLRKLMMHKNPLYFGDGYYPRIRTIRWVKVPLGKQRHDENHSAAEWFAADGGTIEEIQVAVLYYEEVEHLLPVRKYLPNIDRIFARPDHMGPSVYNTQLEFKPGERISMGGEIQTANRERDNSSRAYQDTISILRSEGRDS
jgi:hypothetical protein